jgi:hypothetical protein
VPDGGTADGDVAARAGETPPRVTATAVPAMARRGRVRTI